MAVVFRAVVPGDLPAIVHVRTSVHENHLSVEGMAALGITPERTVAALQAGDLGGWLAEEDGAVLAFSMADRRDGQIFALFTLPGCEGRGLGTGLLSLATAWLGEQGWSEAWLSTDPGTVADRFYAARGWRRDGFRPNGEVIYRLELGGGKSSGSVIPAKAGMP